MENYYRLRALTNTMVFRVRMSRQLSRCTGNSSPFAVKAPYAQRYSDAKIARRMIGAWLADRPPRGFCVDRALWIIRLVGVGLSAALLNAEARCRRLAGRTVQLPTRQWLIASRPLFFCADQKNAMNTGFKIWLRLT